MKRDYNQDNAQNTEEINLQRLFNTLWRAKWVAMASALTLALSVVFLVVIKPIKPDVYHVTQAVEIATLQIQAADKLDKPFLIERTADIVEILPNQISTSVDFTIPKTANKIILMSVVDQDKSRALAQLDEAYRVLEERHLNIVQNVTHAKVVSPTRLVGAPNVSYVPFKSSLKKYLVFALLFGSFLGVLLFLLWQAIKREVNGNNLS